MAPAAQMLATLLQGQNGQLTPRQLRGLQTAAAFDGRLDAQERAVFEGLRSQGKVSPQDLPALDSWMKASAPASPEVDFVRGKDPAAFDKQVQALKKLARPGDVILWRRPPEGAVKILNDPIPHASLVLPNGMYMDTMDREGASILTGDALIAKNLRRIKPDAFVIARPRTPLTAAQLDGLDKAAHELQGRGFSLFAPLEDARFGNCARTIYETFKKAGVDLAPAGQRDLQHEIWPRDFVATTHPVAMVNKAGAVTRDLPFAWTTPGRSFIRKLWGVADRALFKLRPLWDKLLAAEQRNLTHGRLA